METLPSTIDSPKRFQSDRFLRLGPYPFLVDSFPFRSTLLDPRTRYPLRGKQCALDTLQKDLVMQTRSRGATKRHREIGKVGILRYPLIRLTGAH